MLTLGIDPGTASLGYGFVREREDGSLEAVKYGVIRTQPDTPMPKRLKQIHDELVDLIAYYGPDRAAVEELFFSRNVTTAIKVAQAQGVVLLTLQNANVETAEYKPLVVKQSVCNYGGADKLQIKKMVQIMLGLDDMPRPDDAADALAVAITDLHSYRFNSVHPA